MTTSRLPRGRGPVAICTSIESPARRARGAVNSTIRLSWAASALIDRPMRLATRPRITRVLDILPSVRPDLDRADLRRRCDGRGRHRTNGWPNRHDLDVERHITAGCRAHPEVLRKRHRERDR